MCAVKTADVIEIVVPSVGESIREVKLVEWLYQSGDEVNKDVIIASIESEKATLDIYSPAKGILTIEIAEGTLVAIGAVAATLEPVVEQESSASETQETQNNSSNWREELKETNPQLKDHLRITPSALYLIELYGIDPTTLEGTGYRRCLTKQDVNNHLEKETNLIFATQNYLKREFRLKLNVFNDIFALNTSFNKRYGAVISMRLLVIKALSVAWQLMREESDEEDFVLNIALQSAFGTVYPSFKVARKSSFRDLAHQLTSLEVKANTAALEPHDFQQGQLLFFSSYQEQDKYCRQESNEILSLSMEQSSEDEMELNFGFIHEEQQDWIEKFIHHSRQLLTNPIRLFIEV